jgi:pyruvate kinase
VSEKDLRDIQFGAEQGVDLIFASFVRKREHVLDIRKALGEKGKKVQIISKIENLEGIQNFDEILEESDGIMVARGDLGIEIPAPKVVVAQKMMITKCNIVGKPVICATQMLDSMVNNPRPTRAEVSDVANAVLEGADALMLSGETAKGKFPKEAVKSMRSIIKEAEASMDLEYLERRQQMVMPKPATSVEAVSGGAAKIATDQNASLVVVVTETGEGPRLAAKYRPKEPIIAICDRESVARQCCLLRGVIPFVVPFGQCNGNPTAVVNDVISKGIALVKEYGIATEGTAIVLHDSNITDESEMDDWVLRVIHL